MRLNFSGVGEDDIRQGVRLIGKVVNEQVRLYSTLTGNAPAPPRGGAPADERDVAADEGARVLPLRRRAGGER